MADSVPVGAGGLDRDTEMEGHGPGVRHADLPAGWSAANGAVHGG